MGFGLGNPATGIGLQFSAVATSLSNNFGDSGYINIKAARQVSGGRTPTYVGLEVDHLGNWGQARGSKPGVKVALTTFGQVQMGAGRDYNPYMITLGVGSRLRANRTKSGVFFGAGLGLTENLAISAAWTGETVDLGAGFRLSGLPNTYFNAVVNDVTDTRNSRRVTVSVGWALADVFGR
ncbi:MAG: hypothetical protein Q7J57_03720 [Gemmobacter sp.]|nr:hypothetical protein [Gemmobacter sp.]